MNSEGTCDSILSKFTTVLKKLLTLILAIGLTFLVPLTFLVASVFFGTIRQIVKMSAKWIRPDFGKMVTLFGQICAVDKMFQEPILSVTLGLILEGTLDIKRLKETATLNLLNSTFSNGELKYPELKQYLKPWMGYFFWKDDKNFDLDRHITTQNITKLSTYSEQDIQDIYQKLLQKPWNRKRPLWELSLVTNYYPKGRDTTNSPYTVLFFNFHHTLGDGYSFLRLITEGLGEQRTIPINAQPTYSQRNFLQSLVFFITFPFRVGYEFAQIGTQNLLPVPFTPLKISERSFHSSITEKVSTEQIKQIKNHFGVSFASVINAVVTGGLRDFLTKRGNKIPEFLYEAGIITLPGHSEKLRNYMTVGVSALPIGEPDSVKRLIFCSKDYQRLKRSPGPAMIKLLIFPVGSMPAKLLRKFVSRNSITVGLTNFPGGYQHISFEGCKLVDAFFGVGIGPVGINFCALSYVNGLRISVHCKTSIMTKEELTDVTRLLKKHVDILYEKIVEDV